MLNKARNQELLEKADDERRRCRDWLLPFMQNNQTKFLTKNELRAAAIRELKVSKNSFDFAWIEGIERTGRHDWHNFDLSPLPFAGESISSESGNLQIFKRV